MNASRPSFLMKIRVAPGAAEFRHQHSRPGTVFTDRACVDVEALRAGTIAAIEQRDLPGFRILEECRRDFGRRCVDHTSEIDWRVPLLRTPVVPSGHPDVTSPQPPGRVLWKNITCSSEESTARESAALVLSADMFWGSAQGSSSEARVVNHRSSPPRPPGRSEVNASSIRPATGSRSCRCIRCSRVVRRQWARTTPQMSLRSAAQYREWRYSTRARKQSQGSPHDRLLRSSNAVNIQPMHGIRQAATGRTLVVAA